MTFAVALQRLIYYFNCGGVRRAIITTNVLSEPPLTLLATDRKLSLCRVFPFLFNVTCGNTQNSAFEVLELHLVTLLGSILILIFRSLVLPKLNIWISTDILKVDIFCFLSFLA